MVGTQFHDGGGILRAFKEDPTGLSSSLSRVVDASMTASAVGSGGVEVLATPTMILLMETAARDAVRHVLMDGHVTVGVHVDVRHLAATPLGESVSVRAVVESVQGRRLEFSVEARDGRNVVGRGTHTRLAVNLERFVSSLNSN